MSTSLHRTTIFHMRRMLMQAFYQATFALCKGIACILQAEDEEVNCLLPANPTKLESLFQFCCCSGTEFLPSLLACSKVKACRSELFSLQEICELKIFTTPTEVKTIHSCFFTNNIPHTQSMIFHHSETISFRNCKSK